jgi:V/A-type H+-transporting ATPase subunit K
MSKSIVKFLSVNMVLVVLLGAFAGATVIGLTAAKAHGAEAQAVESAKAPSPSAGAGYWAAAVSVGVCVIGAGIAVGMMGSAAIAAVAERPELMGRTILFVGLAEGLAIYGLIIAIMILGRV